MAARRPPRLPADCYRGCGRYFLTICTARRREIFTSESSVAPVRTNLLRTAAQYRFEIIAYCFMKDHLHVLVESTAVGGDFTKVVRMFKQRTGFEYTRSCGEKLWQDGYFDRVLRNEESTLGVVAYILANPVAAGCCREPRGHAFSGSGVYSLDELCDAVAARPAHSWRP